MPICSLKDAEILGKENLKILLTGIINATQLVSFRMWPAEPEDSGNDWVKLLTNYFEQPLKNAGVNSDLLRIEWDLMKNQVYGRFQTQLTTMKL